MAAEGADSEHWGASGDAIDDRSIHNRAQLELGLLNGNIRLVWVPARMMAAMNVDHILDTFNRQGVAFLLIGGMNFLLRHQPVLTYDVDLWIDDTAENRRRCESALAGLDAEWGRTNADWGPVAAKAAGWLDQQFVFCLNSPHGAIDIFRSLSGLTDWQTSFQSAAAEQTSAGTSYHGLSDSDMLQCQLALDPAAQKKDRIQVLQSKLKPNP